MRTGRSCIMVRETLPAIKGLTARAQPRSPPMIAALAAEPPDWNKDEAAHLQNVAQVTEDYVRAGEGYFAPDGKTIIFQAEEKDSGNPFYQIFTTDLETGRTRRVSPGIGKT